jgi:hypothetical protein
MVFYRGIQFTFSIHLDLIESLFSLVQVRHRFGVDFFIQLSAFQKASIFLFYFRRYLVIDNRIILFIITMMKLSGSHLNNSNFLHQL